MPNQIKIDISALTGCICENPHVVVHVFSNTHCWHWTVLIFNTINKNKIKFFISIDGLTLYTAVCLWSIRTFNKITKYTSPHPVQCKQTSSWSRKLLIRMKQQEQNMEVAKSIVNGTMSNFKKLSEMNERTKCLLIFWSNWARFLGSIEKQFRKLTITKRIFFFKKVLFLFCMNRWYVCKMSIRTNINEYEWSSANQNEK